MADPFLRIHAVSIYVRDQGRSLDFYLNTLGFHIAFDARIGSGERSLAVSPTFFYSEFDDRAGRLRYANCGHLPALVLRQAGEVERLEPTAMVLGMFSPWECRTAELRLAAGDLLAIYTDGITEAFDAHDDEFGEGRLVETLQAHRELPPRDLIAAVYDGVRRFSPQEQRDDMTLIVARCRNC